MSEQTPDPLTPFTPQKQSWVTANGFPHWVVAVAWLFVSFVLFQVVAALIVIALLFALGEVDSPGQLMNALTERMDLLFIGNSTGQILFLGLATLLVVKLHLSGGNRTDFLRARWKPKTLNFMVLSGVLFIVVQPVVLLIGYLNSFVPAPEFLAEMQDSQYEMFENFLSMDGVLWLGLFHIALVPAFAEEVLFRGYVLRAFQKSWGIVMAIVVSGFVFAIFHLQLTNILPLATLGILLAVVTWLSGSIWPAVFAHFVNNGAAVIAGTYFPEIAFADMTPETLPPLWIILASVIFTWLLLVYMYTLSTETEKEADR